MTKTPNFNRGDKIVCVDAAGGNLLAVNKEYTVSGVVGDSYETGYVTLEGFGDSSFFSNRFHSNATAALRKDLNKPTKPSMSTLQTTQPRLPNGRFTTTTLKPTVSKKHGGPTQTPAAQPLTLKRGSLYRVTGGAIGRYVGGDVTVKGVRYVTIATHGRPVAVPRIRVGLASKDDVQAYLEDAGLPV